MDDQLFHQEELARRNTQIAGLREELWEVLNRADDAEERTLQLQQGITKAKGELRIRRAKMHELEDQADVAEALGRDTARALMAARSAGVAEVARLRHEMIELDQAYGACADGSPKGGRRPNAALEGEVAATRSRLEVMEQDIERTRSEFAQDEIAAEARQARLVALHRQEGETRVRDAETAIALESDRIAAMRSELARLEAVLATAGGRTGEQDAALKRSVAQREQLVEECGALRDQCRSIEAQAEEVKYGEELAIAKQQCRQLAQDVASAKQNSMLQTQTIQGAIEETQRMMTDHLDQTQRHADEAQRCPAGSSIAAFVGALDDTRAHTASLAAAKRRLEQERDSIDDEVSRLRAALAADRESARQRHASEAEDELAVAQQALVTTNCEIHDASEKTRKAEAAAQEAEHMGREHEKLLRSKLNELWVALYQNKL
mmetsp:Transcript_17649/g.49988  ORF Transcript_17649/g.49988 Transcript_17649/m.49988 type:complete len:436 (+) Transcript_17649:65-1372(+)